MADLTLCRTRLCPRRANCYRYRAVPNPERQSYAGFDPETCPGVTILPWDDLRPTSDVDEEIDRCST